MLESVVRMAAVCLGALGHWHDPLVLCFEVAFVRARNSSVPMLKTEQATASDLTEVRMKIFRVWTSAFFLLIERLCFRFDRIL